MEFTGKTPEDCKVIHMALGRNDKLGIDKQFKVYDADGRWIADAVPRSEV